MSMGAAARDGLETQLGMDRIVLTLSVVLSVLYLTRTRATPSVSRMVIKAGSTALLSAWVAIRGDPPLLAIALGGGSIGDAFLAWHGETPFLFGLGSFLIAHLFYIRLFSQSGTGLGRLVDLFKSHHLDGADAPMSSFWRASVAVILVAFFAPILLSRLIPRVAKDLRVPIVVYTTVIVCMVLAALTMDNGWVVAGALMFTSSDGILATQIFLVDKESAHFAWMPYAVWFLYYTGQLIIACGVSVERL
ncbi:YhhN-like protein [Rhypophila decipiens]